MREYYKKEKERKNYRKKERDKERKGDNITETMNK